MKRSIHWFALLGVAFVLALVSTAQAQRPYIGYVYPAGAQQGTLAQVRLGGQGLDDVEEVLVSGTGVTARLVEYHRRLNNQEVQLLNEQLRLLKKASASSGKGAGSGSASGSTMMMEENSMMMMAAAPGAEGGNAGGAGGDARNKALSTQELLAKVEKRLQGWVQTPACASIASLAFVELIISPEAEPGNRELRLVTPRGVSNPLTFNIGQVPETCRKPMKTATIQILGKEAQALRKRPLDEAEVRIALPCTVNGQIAAGEVNRYRFEARKGQKLVISTQARELVPFIADAVPGWFQPVIVLQDAKGREVAFNDDFRFKPDPLILFTVPEDGEYVCTIHDSIYRGREDFVYRMTIGELPFVTHIFPLGGQAGTAFAVDVDGWNIPDEEKAAPPSRSVSAGVYEFAVKQRGIVSNPVYYALDLLPDEFDREPNNTIATAQAIEPLRVINGRIDKTDDRDVFKFEGRAGQAVALEVMARRLDSPLDSLIKITDAAGRVVAFNDDREDLAAGINTHHADSSLVATLPADGSYYVHISDTARKGGPEYGYRLRISDPRPDFDLRIIPSSLSVRANGTATVTVQAARRDGYAGPINLSLRNPPAGFTASPVAIPAGQNIGRLNLRVPRNALPKPVSISIIGMARVGALEVVREAVPAEDRMQAFLWRHLVPANDFKVLVMDPSRQPSPKRLARVRTPPPPPAPASTAPSSTAPAPTTSAQPASAATAKNGTTPAPTAGATTAPAAAPAVEAPKPKFTKQQIAGRLRQLKLLYEEGLLTEDFYDTKVAECETNS